ncbi:MAG TPA: ABC-2 family transporter protein [Frankiaceae bacterium]|nr:ABC-2 family transporter protein [Frankiaceae bacterium]
MRLWWEIARRAFARQSAYAVAAAAGLFTNTFFGFVRAYVLLEVHEHRPDAGGFDPRQAVTFVFVTQGLIGAMWAFGNWDLGERIKTGAVVVDLYRPVDLQAYEYAVNAGRSAYLLLFRGAVPLLVASLVFDIVLAPVVLAPAVAASILLGVAVAIGLIFLVNLTVFWLLDYVGVGAFAVLMGMLLSGLALPLNYFPHPLDGVVRALPWAATLQLPVELALGAHRTTGGVTGVLATQAAWAIALALAGRAVLARATRKVVVQGG